MPLPSWGGWPFLYALYIANGAQFHPAFRVPFLLPSWQIFRQSGQIFGKKGQKLDFICLALCFLGIFGDKKGQNLNIFLKCGCKVGAGCGSACLPFVGPLVAGGRTFRTCRRWLWSSGRAFPPFCPLVCFVPGGMLVNMALFRVFRGFLAGFMVVACVCVVLVLCVACVAFVRVWS